MNEAGSSRAEHRTGAAEDIAQLHADKAVLHDRLLRALADIENTRRRGERAATDAAQFAISDFARDILTVVDALKRALVAAESHATAENSIIDGVTPDSSVKK